MTQLPSNSAEPRVEFLLDGKISNLFPEYFNKMVVSESILGKQSNAYFRFVDPTYSELESMFIDGLSSISFRYGYASGRLTQFKNFIISYYDVTYTAGGVIIDVWACDKGTLGRTHISTSYGNLSVSDTVKEIVNQNSGVWKLGSLEPTKGSFGSLQNNISDIDFLQQECLSKAISLETGRSDYRLYFRNGDELNFRTPDYGRGIYKTYRVLLDNDHSSMSFKYRVNTLKAFKSGGSKLLVQGYDPIQKEVLQVNLDDENTDKILLGSKLPSYQFTGGDGRFAHIPFKDFTEVEAYAKQIWYHNNMSNVTGYLKLDPDPDLEPGRLVNMQVENMRDGSLLNGSGSYLVEDLVTTLDASKLVYTSHAIMSKNAMKLGTVTPSGTEVTVTKPAQSPQVTQDSDIEEPVEVFGGEQQTKKIPISVGDQ